MKEIQDATADDQVPCPVCNNPNRAGQKFCRHCGASMAAGANPPFADSSCGKCGTVNKIEAKFCRTCGGPLEQAEAPDPWSEPISEPEPEDTAQLRSALSADLAAPLTVKWKANATLANYLIGGVGLFIIIGGGFALKSAIAGSEAQPQMAATVEAASSELASDVSTSTPIESAPSVLQGVYSAHLADQDITLTTVGPPSSLMQLGAIITYSNVVSGGGCSSALEPEAGRSSSPGPAAPLTFRQVPVAGQQTCPRAIPVNLDISGQKMSADGVVQSIQATWLNPDSGEVLMSGQLVRNATQ